MPTVSERQSFIREIMNALEEDISHYMALDGESSDPSQSESDSDSLSSSSSSSSSSEPTSSSGSEEFMSVNGRTDTDEERTIIMGMAADLLQVITETCVLSPHLVAKCSQLDLVLIDFKFHDPRHF